MAEQWSKRMSSVENSAHAQRSADGSAATHDTGAIDSATGDGGAHEGAKPGLSSGSKSLYEAALPYIRIARIDHWFKNVFVLPGVLLALYESPHLLSIASFGKLLFALLCVGLVASSNYVINEILDADRDKLHPVKRNRPVPSGQVNIRLGVLEWIALAVVGLGLSAFLGMWFFATMAGLWIMGCAYNIPPVRLKDKPYADVLSESVNNPLRLLAGWFAVGMTVLPPISLVVAYWFIGAFLMTVKRLAEYRRIGDAELAAEYRSSFRYYNEERLLLCTVYYAVVFGLFFGIFIMRYRLELLLAIPLVAGFIGLYIKLGFKNDSPAQYPEKLYKERPFMLFTGLCFLVIAAMFFIDLPWLHDVFVPTIHTQSN